MNLDIVKEFVKTYQWVTLMITEEESGINVEAIQNTFEKN